MSFSGAGMSNMATATSAGAAAAAIPPSTAVARWTTGTANAPATRAATLVSVLSVPLISNRRAFEGAVTAK